MIDQLVKRISEVPNVLTFRGKRIIPDAMGLTHTEAGVLKGIWWFNLADGKLEYSTKAISHMDPDAFTAAASGSRGWVRGRVGLWKGKCFITIWTCDFPNKVLPGRLIGHFYQKIKAASGFGISCIVDEVGRDLLSGEVAAVEKSKKPVNPRRKKTTGNRW